MADLVYKRYKFGRDRDEDLADVAAYEQARVTCWVENINPWRFGWDEHGA